MLKKQSDIEINKLNNHTRLTKFSIFSTKLNIWSCFRTIYSGNLNIFINDGPNVYIIMIPIISVKIDDIKYSLVIFSPLLFIIKHGVVVKEKKYKADLNMLIRDAIKRGRKLSIDPSLETASIFKIIKHMLMGKRSSEIFNIDLNPFLEGYKDRTTKGIVIKLPGVLVKRNEVTNILKTKIFINDINR